MRYTEGVPTAVHASRILIVEDERFSAIDERNRLASMGYDNVAMSSSGEAAADRAAEDCPDIVLLNIGAAGDPSGARTAELIRSRCRSAIVFVSAYCAERAGVRLRPGDIFLRKPFSDLDFRKAIESALQRGGSGRRASALAPRQGPRPSGPQLRSESPAPA